MRRTFALMVFLLTPVLIFSQIYDDFIGAGHDEGVIVTSSSGSSNLNPSINGDGLVNDLAGASRFLSHASLGANINDLLYVDSIGFEAWLDEQINMPRTSYVDVLQPIDDIVYDQYIELGGNPDIYLTTFQNFRFAWSHLVQTAPDVLRHKVTLALSETLVISSDSDLFLLGFGLASYCDALSKNALGNYKDLLMDVTLHPMMGFYLSYFNNPPSDPVNNIHPDENYAREIMQLFTIGLYELNQDGSFKVDNNGNYIETYDNDDIRELAKVFTGLGMGAWESDDVNFDPIFNVPFLLSDPTVPMRMFDAFHEPGPKTIIGDFTIPAGQTGLEDIEMAVEHLFNHPNTAPFICRRLIQHLVKSNPTPEYIERIANVFDNDGNGERGNMEAVVTAILLDQEARDCFWIDQPSNGKLKEPIQRYTQYARGLRAESPSGWFWNQGFLFGVWTDQFPLHSPTVFNFFTPDYIPNGAFADENMVAPEFQIFNSTSSVGYFNYLYFQAVLGFNNEIPVENFEALGVLENYEAKLNMPFFDELANNPRAIVDYLDLVLAHGNMSQETRNIIIESCEPLEADPDSLWKLILYLSMVSPDFAVMK